MRVFVTLIIAVILTVGVVACNRPVEQPTAATPAPPAVSPQPNSIPDAQPPAVAANNLPAAEKPVKDQAAKPPAASTQPAKTAPAVSAGSARVESPAAPAPPPAPVVAAPQTVEIPAGTMLSVVMVDSLSTETNKVGDTFTATLADPLTINGKTALAKGTRVRGRVETLDEPGRVKGRAAISLVLTQLVSKDKPYAIATQPFSAQAESETKENAVKVGGGAVIGSIVGAIAGGKKGAAIGAAVGGGAGTTAVLATKGQQLRIDSETRVNFVLRNEVEVEVTRN